MAAQTTATGAASSLLALVGTATAQRSFAGQGLLPSCFGLAGLLVTFTAYQVPLICAKLASRASEKAHTGAHWRTLRPVKEVLQSHACSRQEW